MNKATKTQIAYIKKNVNLIPMLELKNNLGLSVTYIRRICKEQGIDVIDRRKKFHIDLEKLAVDIKTMTRKDIAAKYGCSTMLISKTLEKHKIPTPLEEKPRVPNPWNQKDWNPIQ